MSRVRAINPGFFLDDELAECDPLARILFAGLWVVADREGRLKDRPRRIKPETLPYDECDMDALLDQLAVHNFIHRYEVDGVHYIAIPSWKKYQNPHHKEAESVIPEPTDHAWAKLESSMGQAWSKHGSSLPAVPVPVPVPDRDASLNQGPVDNSQRTCWRCGSQIDPDDVLEDRCVLSRKGLRHEVCP